MGYLEYTFISRINPAYDEELDAFIEYAKKDPRFNIIIKAVGYVNLYYAFIVKDHEELKELRRKIQSLLGDSVMQEYKVEVDEMIS